MHFPGDDENDIPADDENDNEAVTLQRLVAPVGDHAALDRIFDAMPFLVTEPPGHKLWRRYDLETKTEFWLFGGGNESVQLYIMTGPSQKQCEQVWSAWEKEVSKLDDGSDRFYALVEAVRLWSRAQGRSIEPQRGTALPRGHLAIRAPAGSPSGLPFPVGRSRHADNPPAPH